MFGFIFKTELDWNADNESVSVAIFGKLQGFAKSSNRQLIFHIAFAAIYCGWNVHGMSAWTSAMNRRKDETFLSEALGQRLSFR